MIPDVLVPLRAKGEGLPLYCIHAASGSCYPYLPLVTALDDRPVIGIETPGYDGDDLPPASLEELADCYAQVVDKDRRGGRVCLLGWSAGGVIAFETARKLLQLGCSVPLVVLVDTQVPVNEPMPTDRMIRARFVADFASEAFAEVSARMADVLQVWASDPAADEIWEPLRERGWIPDELGSATLERRFQVFRANVLALQRHRPRPGYDGPVLAIRARNSPPELRQWSEFATDVREVTVSGDHYSLWHGDGPTEISRLIQDAVRTEVTSSPNGSRG